MVFAGVWVQGCPSIRKLKDRQTIDDQYVFLTCDPNAEVEPIHTKAMPVLLTDPAEWAAWLTAAWTDARALQRPLLDGVPEVME